MMKKSYYSTDPAYQPYSYKGLKGRYAHWHAENKNAKRTFVLVYGQHATLERIEPVVKVLCGYGDVYAVDTPGFGGMQPSYAIKEKPNLDFMAGHLEHFISNYIPKDRLLTVMGISYGFQIITTMLEQSKDLQKRTENAISFAGFVCGDDFKMPLSYTLFFEYFLGSIGKTYVGSKIFSFFSSKPILTFFYFLARPYNVQYRSLEKTEAENYLGQQIWLWQSNDFRTHASTAWDFWKNVDMRNYRIPVSLIHIGVPKDHLLKNSQISDELRAIYSPAETLELNLNSHAPLDINSPDKVRALLPAKLKELLSKSDNKTAEVS